MPVDGHASLGYDSGTNRITTAGFEYDAAGNQIKAPGPDGSGLLFEYDAAGRISVIRKESDNSLVQAFQYGSTNARLMDTNYGFGYLKLFASTGGTTLAEYTEFTAAAPTWTKSYTYFGSSQLATITPNGSGGEYTEFNHPDRLGTRLVTNQQGGTSYEQVHLPYGAALNTESTLQNNNKRFTSYDRSSATGLDYAINRTYDSKQGRFTTVDPIGMQAASLVAPQTLNMYNYCGNDPVNYTDPSGLFFGKLFKWIGKAFNVLNKILKWIAVVVVVILVVAFVVYTAGGGMPAFLGGGKGLLGILGKIAGKIGASVSSFMAKSIGVAIGTVAGGSLAGALYSVGAVASSFQQRPKQRKRQRKPCPPNLEDLIAGRGWDPSAWFKSTVDRVLELSSNLNRERVDAGRWKEVGGWILLSKDGRRVQAVIKTPEAAPTDTGTQVSIGEPRRHIRKLLDEGWLIVGDFHSHHDKLENSTDIEIANARKQPGAWIFRDGTVRVYGPPSGILNEGVPSHCRR